MNTRYQFALEFFKEDATPAGQFPLEVDWEPAIEATRFLAIRRRDLEWNAGGGEARVEPAWHSTQGPPYVDGFSVELEGDSSSKLTGAFGSTYFIEKAQKVFSRLVAAGELPPGEKYFYLPVAHPLSEPPQKPKASFTAHEVIPTLHLKESSLDARRQGASLMGSIGRDDMPVFIPRHILDEVKELAREAGPKETGGILIGHLYRDPDEPEIFAEVTAQIHARNAVADCARLTFTAETWADARAALALRKQGEVMVGWWHSHPVSKWCEKCPPEKRRTCAVSKDFFSTHDVALHRTIFPRAYSVALVINGVGASEFSYSLFGWNQGVVASRGFYVSKAINV